MPMRAALVMKERSSLNFLATEFWGHEEGVGGGIDAKGKPSNISFFKAETVAEDQGNLDNIHDAASLPLFQSDQHKRPRKNPTSPPRSAMRSEAS